MGVATTATRRTILRALSQSRRDRVNTVHYIHTNWLVQHVDSSPFGVPLSWESLADLLNNLVQVVDGNFVGCSDPAQVPRVQDTDLPTLHHSCELVVTAFDSTLWWVSAPQPVIKRLQVALPHAEQ
jgi:hypothetical protein